MYMIYVGGFRCVHDAFDARSAFAACAARAEVCKILSAPRVKGGGSLIYFSFDRIN